MTVSTGTVSGDSVTFVSFSAETPQDTVEARIRTARAWGKYVFSFYIFLTYCSAISVAFLIVYNCCCKIISHMYEEKYVTQKDTVIADIIVSNFC